MTIPNNIVQWMNKHWDPYFELGLVRKLGNGTTEYLFYEPVNRGDSVWISGIIENDMEQGHLYERYKYFSFESRDTPAAVLVEWKLKSTPKLLRLLKKQDLQHTKEKKLTEDESNDWYDYKRVDYDMAIGKYLAKRAGFVEVRDESKKKQVHRNNLDQSMYLSLKNVYYPGFAFPGWAADKITKNYDKLMKPVEVYYDTGGSCVVVKRLATQREPVNIAGNRYYDQNKLATEFGWQIGYYNRYYQTNRKLAPNIAVYTPTFVEIKGKTNTLIHVINSVGYAFDDRQQVDYKYFSKGNHQSELKKRYEDIFEKIYFCATRLKLSTVVMSLVGGNNFARLYPGGVEAFQEKIWVPAFLVVESRYPYISTSFMGATKSLALKLVCQHLPAIVDIGLFPGNIKQIDVSNTLFVNSWDPLSLPGNGNAKDNSLDGYIGRLTNIALNGSGMTNPFMKFVAVPLS